MKITNIAHYKFIKASLDDNQVHTDINVATKLGANSRIIHGVHQILYILNTLKISEIEISSLNFNFIKPLSAGQDFEIYTNKVENTINFSIENSITIFTSGFLKLHNLEHTINNRLEKPKRFPYNNENLLEPVKLMEFNLAEIVSLYPWLKEQMSINFLTNLLYISYYFGVEISYKNNMIINVHVSANYTQQNSVVRSFSKKHGLAECLEINSPNQKIKAIGRKFELYDSSNSNFNLNLGRYGAQKAVIFGGTGSLGSTIAKLLIRDGSQVHITYRSREKLETIYGQELNLIVPWKYNLLENNIPEVDGITHLYYLLTPSIFLPNKPNFSTEVLQTFSYYYIDNLRNVISAYSSSSLQFVFSPSTKAIDEPVLNLKEYITSKKEMEFLLQQISILNPNLTISYPRIEAFESLQTTNISKSSKKPASEIAYKYLPVTS
jgi:hypothetical protein